MSQLFDTLISPHLNSDIVKQNLRRLSATRLPLFQLLSFDTPGILQLETNSLVFNTKLEKNLSLSRWESHKNQFTSFSPIFDGDYINQSRKNFFPFRANDFVERDPVVVTDKSDYPPGSTAIISSNNFDLGETIELQVLHIDGVPNTGGGHEPWFVTDGGVGDLDGVVDGNFQTSWYVNPDDSLDSTFELTATGLSSSEVATTTFTDGLNDISGTVYRDYNLDGVQQAPTQNGTSTGQAGGEPGIAGVSVTAYDTNGNTYVTTTDSGGNYTFDSNLVGLGDFRLEFDLPTDLEAASSLVQFVNNSSSSVTDIDVALHRPSEYVATNNPFLFTSCFVFGDQVDGANQNEHILVAYAYDGSTTNNSPIFLADANEIGSVYGLDFERDSQNVFAATYTKAHAGYGSGGAGAIYQISITSLGNADTNPNNGITAADPVKYVNLNDIFGSGTIEGVDRSSYGNTNSDWIRDNAGFQGAGKTAYGDLDITEDGKYILTVNLEDKKLYAIPTSGTLNSSTILRFDLPNPNSALSSARQDDIRPFGLGINDGKVFVGMVDSAQSSGLRTDLDAYVYEFDFDTDTGTATFNSSPVLQFDLDYDRGDAWSDRGASADWQPWEDDFNEFTDGDRKDGYHTADEGSGRYNWVEGAQPILADIEFDNDSIILGFRDRLSDQIGANTFNPIDETDSTEYYVFQAGDIVRAAPNGSGGFNLESGGSVDDGFGGILTSADTGNGRDDGPGDGEFYYDVFGGHQEQVLGGLYHIPGSDTTAYNAGLGGNRGGTIVVNNIDGSNADGGTNAREILYSLSSSVTGFNKANGLGDLEAFGAVAPIEIGGRIWLDTDNDGIQDPDEVGTDLSGVTVNLYNLSNPASPIRVGTTTIDSNGEYYFNDDNVTLNSATGINTFTSYQVRFDNTADFTTGGKLDGFNLTAASQSSNGEIDSDAVNNSTPTISLTTGDFGENEYSYDAGFTNTSETYSLGNRVWTDTDNDGVINGSETGIDSVVVNLYADSDNDNTPDGTAIASTTTASGGYYRFDDLVAGNYIVEIASSNFGTGNALGNLNSSSVDENEPDSDIDSNDNGIGTGGSGVFSNTVTLGTSTSEPTGESDTIAGGAADNLSNLTVDFGFADTDGSITGNVTDQITSSGIASVTLNLVDSNGNIIDTVTTDGSGDYTFSNVAPGNYTVVEIQPNNFTSVSEVDGG